MSSWTVSLFRQTRPYFNLSSFFRYRDFLLNQPQTAADELLKLGFKSPVGRPIFLRKVGSDILTFQEVFIDQAYRPVVEHLDSCGTLIDIGANIGLASLYLNSRYNCRCFCIEPNPDNFRILRMNFANTDVRLLNAAVWSSPIMLTPECEQAHYSMSTVIPHERGTIPGLPMSEILRQSQFKTVDLLKVDIEGAEVELFRQDLSWLEAVRAIAIEFHGDSRKAIAFDDLMRKHRFEVIEGGHTTVAFRR